MIDFIESGTSVNAIDFPADDDQLGVLKTSAVYTRKFRPEENKAVVHEERGRVTCPLREGAIIVSRMNTPELVGAAGLVDKAPANIYLPDRLWQVVVEPSHSCAGYLHWFMCSQAYSDQIKIACSGSSSSMQNLGQDQLRGFLSPKPPLQLQFAIASYLDVETARIDGLIDDKQALADTLKEMRRSTVAEAITMGVRGARTMRPSGLSWVAEIPADWRTLSLKRFVRLSGGHTPATGNPAYWDGTVPWFSPKDMKADELHDSIDHVTDLAVDESGLHVIDPGTTMIVVRGMILAHTFPVCVAQVKATINQDMKALVPEEDVHQRFLPWLLRGASALFLSLTEQSAHGTMALRTDRFMGEKLPIPPVDEQLEIVEHLEAERQRIDLLLRQVDDEIGLLRELRAATITDAVLGRIDVREHMKN